MDAANKKLSIELEMNGLEAYVPFEFFLADKELSAAQLSQLKNLSLHLEKIAAQVTIMPEADKVVFDRIAVSQNPYTLKHDGATLIEVNFPKIQEIEAVISKFSEGAKIEFSAGASIAVMTQFKGIEDIIGSVPKGFADETMEIELIGAAPVLSGLENQLEMTKGEALVKSRAANMSVAVPLGQCVEFKDVGAEFWIEEMIVSDCR